MDSRRVRKLEITTQAQAPRWPEWISWVALALGLALVVTRATTAEYLRDTFEVTPGSEAAPRAPGPATSLGLDLLCCAPALLVLVRRVKDDTFSPRTPRSFIPLALLCAWMLASAAWSADRFAALVTACHWASAISLMWAAAQLVRRWVHLRLVAAVLFAVVAVYAVQAFNFRFGEGPALLKMWNENREKMLKDRGWEPGSFAARQFEDKLKLMEVFGFFNSPNTFGGALSLLCVVGLGLLVQRAAEREAAKWAVPAVAVPLAAGLVVMVMTKSKGAFTTFALSAIGMAALWRWRGLLARHSRKAFFVGAVAVAGMLLAVVAFGLARGRLPTSTLTFRWQYWVGAARMIKARPLLGTGWSNFGSTYLAYRVPNAPEEIKDPHNFLVRFGAELGLVGLALVIAWFGRLWWELTRPAVPAETSDRSAVAPGVLKFVAAVAGGATLIYLLVIVDWAREPVEFLLIRLLYLAAIVLVAALAGLKTLTTQGPDERPAPWLLYAMLLAVGGMLVHNLIDFSMFEIGPMFLWAMLAGSALGIRAGQGETRRTGAGWWLTAAVIVWLMAACLVWMPIATAERKAGEADDNIRGGQLAAAETLLDEANRDAWRMNADYAFRAARITPPERARRHLAEAIEENPKEALYRYGAARTELQAKPPNRDAVRENYRKALELDPNNVRLRLEYAETLAGWGDRAEASKEYQEALRYNDLLNWDEKKRLSKGELNDVRAKMQALR